jgi:hypothetical protein
MKEEEFKKLFSSVVEAYERTYLDATIFSAVLRARGLPNLDRKLELYRHRQDLVDYVHSKFEPLYTLLENWGDEEEIRRALVGIPPPKRPN